MKTAIGTVLVMVGLMAMAGSAGDCDGACMDQANSLSVMIMVIGGGLTSMALGATMMLKVR